MTEQIDFYLPAVCRRDVYRNEANNYAVFSAELNEKSPYYDATKYPATWIPKWGSLPSVCITTNSLREFKNVIDKPMVFTGKIIEHKKHGKQFEAWGCFVDEPVDKNAMEVYLATLPNIGEERARILIQLIGADKIGQIIENDPQQIVALKIGLTEDRMLLIKERWLNDIAMREVHMWIARHGISALVGKKIISEWKEKAIDILEEDPYRLTTISGIGFKTADDIAYKILNPVPSEQRVKAAMEHVLEEATQDEGHLCLTYDVIKKRTLSLLLDREPEKDYRKLIEESIVSKDPLRFSSVMASDKKIYVYRVSTWKKVRTIAESLVSISKLQSLHTCSPEDITFAENDLKRYWGKPDFELNELQKKAIGSAFEKKITILTGGGGTGKSTICRAIVKIAQSHRADSGVPLSIVQMTPTGKAAKVLNKKTSHSASTIHKALRLKPGEEATAQTIEADILIIDEFSMCGLDTVFAIFSALKNNPRCNIVFVGDPQQLPSVSPGNFLTDIIASGVANVIKLDMIYRQGEKSLITTIADDVAKGRATTIPKDAEDIEIKNIVNGDEVVRFACDAMTRHLDSGGDIDDIQMLSPQYAGPAGVDRINASLQQLMAERNKVLDKMYAGDSLFYIGDKVMQLKNNYEKDVYNGDIGIVKEMGVKVLDPKTNLPEQYISVFFEDRGTVEYKTGDFSEIKPAWCITIHKFQGSQCKKVVFVMFRGHSYMLNRELVYTGITRAEKHVLILGNEELLPRISRISTIKKRNTTLVDEIGELLGSGAKLFYYNCFEIEDSLPVRVKKEAPQEAVNT